MNSHTAVFSLSLCVLSLTLFWATASADPSMLGFDSGTHEPVVHLTNSQPISGITAAGSTFKDRSTRGMSVNTVGSASFVRDLGTGKIVVLTASHVVAGDNPWVEINSRHVPVTQLLLDNDRDLAILEIPQTQLDAAKPSTSASKTWSAIEPALIFANDGLDSLKVAPEFMAKIESGHIPTVVLAYYLPGHALGFALRPWVNPGTETARQRAIVHAPIVSRNYDGEQVRIFTKVTAGASGSAVLDLREQRVAGLIVQSHYYLSETYLASPEVLKKHFDLFNTGARGTVSETSWRLKNGLAYRVFPGEIEEASFVSQRTSGIIGQPGAGVIGQPGAGVIGQPGAGVIGQPGAGVIAQPGAGVIAQPGAGVIAQPGSGAVTGQAGAKPAGKDSGFLPWSANPQAVFDFYHLQPGMNFQGRSVIALKVHEREGYKALSQDEWPADFTALAEPEALQLLKARENRFTYEPLGLDTDFVRLLHERLHADPETTLHLQTLFGPSAVADDMELKAQPESCEVTVGKTDVHVKVKAYARMNRETWKLEPDEIEFTLTQSGAHKDMDGNPGSTGARSRQFFPVIETKGLKTGETYYVDLRQFFFTDVSQLMRPMPDWSKENAPFDLSRFDLKTQISQVAFSVRNANSGAEFSYGFAAPSPVQKR